jgi:hypothetical protein
MVDGQPELRRTELDVACRTPRRIGDGCMAGESDLVLEDTAIANTKVRYFVRGLP